MTSATAANPSGPAPLIPRDAIFGNPEMDAPQLSPDGTMLAYLAPYHGKQSVWVRTIGARDDRVIAHDPDRPIPSARWRGDSRHVLYQQDRQGDENYHLFQVDSLGGAPRDMTPGENIRAMLLVVDPRVPNDALISLNARNTRLFDVHRLHLDTGASVLDTENPGDVVA